LINFNIYYHFSAKLKELFKNFSNPLDKHISSAIYSALET